MSGNAPITPPEMDKTPPKNEMAEAMGTLGMLTMGCELGDPSKKSACQELIKPLEEGKEKAVETMTNVIMEFGPEFLDDAMDELNLVVYEAAQRAKDKMIAEGRLNQDGSPRE